jgi:hypothetical protein
MSDMVELPRNPIDFRIDQLSPAALEGLQFFKGVACADNPLSTPVYEELVAHGFVTKKGELIDALSFDGHNAQLRVNSGIYHHHKAIYAKRAARDAAMEEMRDLAIF